MIQIQFKEWTCTLSFAKYSNGRTAITLSDAEDFMPIAKATVNIPEAHLEDDEVLIKDWSENEGIYQALVKAGVISKLIETVPSGYADAFKCKLLKRE